MKLLQRNPGLIDDRQLVELVTESQDLHADAMRDSAAVLPDLRDLAADRLRAGNATSLSSAETGAATESRAALIRRLALATGGLFGFGALSTLFAQPAGAASLDIQMLQTATSLELLAVATYEAALTLPFIADGNAVVKAFAETTKQQHDEHRQAFAAQTVALGGAEQTEANPKYAPIVQAAVPNLKGPGDVVALAITLEQVATETYLADLNQFTDVTSRVLTASVMGVESQHLAILRAVNALLLAAPELIKIPIGKDAFDLPNVAGIIAFSGSFQGVDLASPTDEGAVK